MRGRHVHSVRWRKYLQLSLLLIVPALLGIGLAIPSVAEGIRTPRDSREPLVREQGESTHSSAVPHHTLDVHRRNIQQPNHGIPTPPSESPTSSPSESTSPSPSQSEEEVGGGESHTARRVLQIVNRERAKAGCPAVSSSVKLTRAAAKHSNEMANGAPFSHTSPDGSTPQDRSKAAGYNAYAGENIASGYEDPATVMREWMDSEGHRANILNCDARATGLARAQSDDGTFFWTQMFGYKK